MAIQFPLNPEAVAAYRNQGTKPAGGSPSGGKAGSRQDAGTVHRSDTVELNGRAPVVEQKDPEAVRKSDGPKAGPPIWEVEEGNSPFQEAKALSAKIAAQGQQAVFAQANIGANAAASLLSAE